MRTKRPQLRRYRGTIRNLDRKHDPHRHLYNCVIAFSDLVEVETGKSPGALSVPISYDDDSDDEGYDALRAGAEVEFSAHPTRDHSLQDVSQILFRHVSTEPVTDETNQPTPPVAPVVTRVTPDAVTPVTNQPTLPESAPVTGETRQPALHVTTDLVTPVTPGVPTAADAVDPTMDRSRQLIEGLIRDESQIVPTAKEVVGKWGAAMKEGAEKEKPVSYVACDVCYWMSLHFEKHPEEQERFLKDSKVKKPKKGSSPFYLLVATLFADDKGNLTRAEQSYATRIGGVLRYCRERKMDQGTYMRFIRTEGGPFGVYERYVKIPRPPKDALSPLEINKRMKQLMGVKDGEPPAIRIRPRSDEIPFWQRLIDQIKNGLVILLGNYDDSAGEHGEIVIMSLTARQDPKDQRGIVEMFQQPQPPRKNDEG